MVQDVFAWYCLVRPKPESLAALRIIWYCLVQTDTACDTLRGLGKDEVASSNLAISSRKAVVPSGRLLFSCCRYIRTGDLTRAARYNHTKPAQRGFSGSNPAISSKMSSESKDSGAFCFQAPQSSCSVGATPALGRGAAPRSQGPFTNGPAAPAKYNNSLRRIRFMVRIRRRSVHSVGFFRRTIRESPLRLVILRRRSQRRISLSDLAPGARSFAALRMTKKGRGAGPPGRRGRWPLRGSPHLSKTVQNPQKSDLHFCSVGVL